MSEGTATDRALQLGADGGRNGHATPHDTRTLSRWRRWLTHALASRRARRKNIPGLSARAASCPPCSTPDSWCRCSARSCARPLASLEPATLGAAPISSAHAPAQHCTHGSSSRRFRDRQQGWFPSSSNVCRCSRWPDAEEVARVACTRRWAWPATAPTPSCAAPTASSPWSVTVTSPPLTLLLTASPVRRLLCFGRKSDDPGCSADWCCYRPVLVGRNGTRTSAPAQGAPAAARTPPRPGSRRSRERTPVTNPLSILIHFVMYVHVVVGQVYFAACTYLVMWFFTDLASPVGPQQADPV